MRQQKLNEIFLHLMHIRAIASWRDLSQEIGVNSASLSSAKNGDTRYLTDNLFTKINTRYGGIFNEDWWHGVSGTMLHDHEAPIDETYSQIMERKLRFNEAFNFLRMKGRIKTQKECANLMNYKEGTFSRALKGNPDCLTDNFLRIFNSTFDNIFNIDWLLTGEGTMTDTDCAMYTSGVTLPKEAKEQASVFRARYDEAMRYVKKLEADNIVLQETNKRLLDMLERALSGATSSIQSKAQ